jgi:hypothetical protein
MAGAIAGGGAAAGDAVSTVRIGTLEGAARADSSAGGGAAAVGRGLTAASTRRGFVAADPAGFAETTCGALAGASETDAEARRSTGGGAGAPACAALDGSSVWAGASATFDAPGTAADGPSPVDGR